MIGEILRFNPCPAEPGGFCFCKRVDQDKAAAEDSAGHHRAPDDKEYSDDNLWQNVMLWVPIRIALTRQF